MFTAVLLLVSVGAAFYFLAGIAEIMLDGRVRQFFRRRKRVREIHKLKDHHLVCGYGRIGFVICREFRRENHPYTVIKNDPEKSAQLIDNNIPIVVGDATSYATLIEAGVEHAMRLISSMPPDAENVFVTLSAKHLNKNLFVVAHAVRDSGDPETPSCWGQPRHFSLY